MSKLNLYLDKLYNESFEGLKPTKDENCDLCAHASFYSPDGTKRDFPACKMHGLRKGSHENCIDFEKRKEE